MKLTKLLLTMMVSGSLALPQMGAADSQLSFGGAGTTAAANLDFQIIIPNFVFFQVGTLGSVDQVEYDMSLGPQPGSGGPIAANGGIGDGADGSLTVNLATNATNVSIGATGGTLAGATANIPFAEITASGTGTIPVPDFGATISPFAPGLLALTDTWSYTYDNTAIYPADTYTGTVIYTVTVL